ncbi:MAG: class B sortase [Erysipelotrichaceae bacterium]|nr:class B sortase [Erysipelotrichaceae bacterium]MDP3306007.1 class B sortase [Erysipelotrichaceae bacterium]
MNIRKIVRLFAVLLILTSVGLLGFEYWEYSQFKEQKEELVEISNTFVPPVTNTDTTRDYYAEFNQQFLGINKDYAGWISIGGTEIDYPMVKGTNNSYYLTRNFQKERSKYGAIFMDYRNAKDFSDKHVMVYGHAMRNDAMFGFLDRYKKSSYLPSKEIIEIRTLEGIRRYEIFSVYVAEATVSGMKVPANDQSMASMIKLYKGRSLYKIDIDMTDVTQILTLVSCDYSIDDGRIIIHARLINN